MLRNLFEQRAVTFQTIWGSGGDLVTESNAGVAITGKNAFEIVAFFSAVSLISDTISSLPCDSFVRVDGERRPYRPRPAWVDQPDVDTTRQAHYGAIVSSLLVYGNSYTRVFRNNSGEVVNLVVLDPNTVEVKRNSVGRKMFVVQGEKQALTSDEVLHIIDLADNLNSDDDAILLIKVLLSCLSQLLRLSARRYHSGKLNIFLFFLLKIFPKKQI